jgi:ribosomal protein S18 acetylase RimI-like enzyme
MAKEIAIRPIEPADRPWVLRFLQERWGSDRMVGHGEMFYPGEHAGFIAMRGGEPTGLLTYRIAGDACEITLIDSGIQHGGIGTTLLAAVEEAARRAGCTRLWLITTNDNLDALRFYQRRGFVLKTLHANAAEAARRLKPEIPLVGDYGIPMRDEIELEMLLVPPRVEQP